MFRVKLGMRQPYEDRDSKSKSKKSGPVPKSLPYNVWRD